MSGALEGKTAFVTGGAGGIGSAICARFAREGAEVIAADLTSDHTSSDSIEFLEYDVTDEGVCLATFLSLGKRWRKLDILVNAAGIEIEKTIEETSLTPCARLWYHGMMVCRRRFRC